MVILIQICTCGICTSIDRTYSIFLVYVITQEDGDFINLNLEVLLEEGSRSCLFYIVSDNIGIQIGNLIFTQFRERNLRQMSSHPRVPSAVCTVTVNYLRQFRNLNNVFGLLGEEFTILRQVS